MRFVIPVYGKESTWLPVLGAWLSHFKKFHSLDDVIIITTLECKWVHDYCESNKIKYYKVDSVGYVVYSNLNLSGILLARAAQICAPCLVITLDCEVLKPIPEGDYWMNSDLALGLDNFMPDGGRMRTVNRHIFREYSCAVAWMGKDYVGDMFLDYWEELIDNPQARSIRFWEQVVWAYVFNTMNIEHEGSAVLYPEKLNWSSAVRDNGNVIIKHWHGKRKNELYRKWGLQ